jgi:nanoRNase/pAp phosphatase (c-di-AMP/oligoRNAs hydrolase)
MVPLQQLFDRLQLLFQNAQTVALGIPEGPDGDAVGSMLALRMHLDGSDPSLAAVFAGRG